MFPTLKQGVIAGVFKIKGASSWAIIRAGKIQVSVFLPNEHSMDDWLCPQWSDVSMMGINNLRKVVVRLSPHAEEVSGMWGNVRPRWWLLQQHLEAVCGPFTLNA